MTIPSVVGSEFIFRARELQDPLRERVPQAYAERRIPQATIDDFHRADLFRMLQPQRFGGYEADPRAFFDTQIAIATACPSSGWVFGVVAVHAWQLALFPLEAQEDVWRNNPRALISSSYAPTGKIERVDGGYRVSGRWSFSSGCDHCDWVFLGGFAPSEGHPDMRTFLLPRKDYTIEDNWHVMGLRGTGSKDIVVNGAFVPEHRTHRLIDGFKRVSPGNDVNPAPLYRLPFGQIFSRSVSTSAIGMLTGALDVYRESTRQRVAAGDMSKVAEDPTAQMACARAASTLDEVQLVLHRNFDEMMSRVRVGEDIPIERRVAFRFDSANTVEKCVQAVDGLFTASGGRAIFLGNPILRYFLDVHAARAHFANNPDKSGRNFGGVQFKLKNQDFFI